MAQIVSLLNGENINQDHQITALHKALINPGIISGLTVTAGQVAVGEAFIECTRSNGEKIMVHFMNTAPLNIDTSGNKKIFIEVKQENIDNGIINAEDGSNMGEIKSVANYPTKNFIPLASVTGGAITDERKFIGKKIPNIQSQNKKPKDYNSNTFYGPELVGGNAIGIPNVNFVNLHTYSSSTNDPSYITQTAIVAQGALGIWIRKAKNQDEWWSWQKVFPVSAENIAINDLSEINDLSGNDFLILQNNGVNKKIKFSNLNKNVLPKNKQVDVTSTSLSIPNGALVNLGVFVDSGGAPTVIKGVKLLHSTNNSTWSEFCVMGGVRGAMVRSFFVPSGFIKIEETNNTDWRSGGTTWAVAQLL